ncbi:MAG: cysteine desulfurase family protein [bacterium]
MIYLDNAATTKIDPKVKKTMEPYFFEFFGNASSLHFGGLKARQAVDEAQAKIADFLRCQAKEVYFTSGATESDNWAILGLTRAFKRQKNDFKPHIIISQIEHDAILAPAKELQREGVEVTFLAVDKNGLVDVKKVSQAIKSNTILVSIMYANNEIGTVQPIKEIGKIIKEENKKRKNKIYFHTDATQAVACLDCNVEKLGVDLLSLSAHKIYGPKGVGILYIKNGTPIEPIMLGGGQQNNKRSGTYNVAGIVGLGRAVELLLNKKVINLEVKKIKQLRDYLVKEIKNKIPRTIVTGDIKNRLPGNASFIFAGAEGESILLMLSNTGIAVSTGSACSSGSLAPSHVLVAMGVKPELAHGSIRVSIGRFNTKKDIDIIIKKLPPIIERLRKMSPLQ